MALNLGSGPVDNIMLGDQQVDKVYLGSSLVWEHSTAPVFPEVTIGTQTWMSVNLDIDDGLGGIYAYDDNEANVATYGRLYTWDAAVRVAASIDGWHLPSDAEWTQLETYLTNNGYNYDGTIGGMDVRYKIGKSMASINNWAYSSAKGVVGNTDYPTYRNKSGLTLQPGGMRYYSTTNFLNLNCIGYWWTSISDGSFMATTRYIMHTQKNIRYGPLHKNNAVSVRLIKDTP